MNQEPDSYEDNRQNGGAVAWLFISLGLVCLVGMIVSLCGCTYNRNAPLLDFKPTIEANGNTVPVSAAP